VSVVALASAHGAPGVTTTALALVSVWPLVRPGRRVLLIDADPAGSGLLTGLLSVGIPETAGISVLAAVRPPLTDEQVIGCSVALDDDSDRMVLPGIVDPLAARPLAAIWTGLLDVARDLSMRGVDVLVDTGRLGHRQEPTPWLTDADVLLLVGRSDLASVLPTAAAARGLAPHRAGRATSIGVVVDPGPYASGELGTALGVGEVLTVPRDEWAARVCLRGARHGVRFDRSPLMRSARALVERLVELVPEPGAAVAR
jgi:hypothetical protein